VGAPSKANIRFGPRLCRGKMTIARNLRCVRQNGIYVRISSLLKHPLPASPYSPTPSAQGRKHDYAFSLNEVGGVRRSREGVRDLKTAYGGPVLRGIAGAMFRHRKRCLGMRINGGIVSLPASSPFERFCFVVVFARWPKALFRNAAICAEICGKSIVPYLFNTAITQGSLLQRRTFTWRGLLGLKCAGVVIAPGSCPRLPGTLATSTNIRRRCTWFWQI
jgi:hypothetical protein